MSGWWPRSSLSCAPRATIVTSSSSTKIASIANPYLQSCESGPANSWETSTRSGLVSIGTHALFISTAGKPRRAKEDPVVIFFTGRGVPIAAHARLQCTLAAYARVYLYDRASVEAHQRAPRPRTLHPTLALLLRAIDVMPLYKLVAHSYGSFIAREFLALRSRVARDAVVQ